MPLGGRPLIVAAAVAYLLIVLAIGGWAARRTRSPREFFIAGQRVGLIVTGLTTMSAAFSGFVFLGGPGLTYRIGLSALWIVLPVGLTGGLLCWVVGGRLRVLAGMREIYTVPDALACRFGSRAVAGLAAVAVASGSVAYLAAQLLALGILLQSIFGIAQLQSAMLFGLAVLLGYSVAGGMLAGVYTDLAQGLLMLVAASAVFVKALQAAGGWRAMTESIAGSERFGPAFLEPLGHLPVFTAFGFFFIFSVGVLGQPQMLHKFYMIDDPRKLRYMPLVLGASQALCLLVWIGIGLAVPALVARGAMDPLLRADDAAPRFLMEHTPDLLAGLVLSALLGAIMSTADSFLNIGAAALARDLPRALGRPLRGELAWVRGAIVGVGLAATFFALAYDDLIALLGTFAFGTFGAALAPAFAIGLCWRRVTAPAAAASIATGLALTLSLELLGRRTFAWLPASPLADGVPPAAAALAASIAVLFVVTWLTPPPTVDPEIAAVVE